jgi:hypothetical protein
MYRLMYHTYGLTRNLILNSVSLEDLVFLSQQLIRLLKALSFITFAQ